MSKSKRYRGLIWRRLMALDYGLHISLNQLLLMQGLLGRCSGGEEDMGEVEVPVQMTSKVRAYSREHPYRRS